MRFTTKMALYVCFYPEMYPECVLGRTSSSVGRREYWTMGPIGRRKKSNVYANHKRQEKTASHDMQICVLWKQFLSSVGLFTVHFAVSFRTKTFLITLVSRSCSVTIMKQSTLFGPPAVKRKTTEGVAEVGSPDPKVAKSFCKQWLKDFKWLEHTDVEMFCTVCRRTIQWLHQGRTISGVRLLNGTPNLKIIKVQSKQNYAERWGPQRKKLLLKQKTRSLPPCEQRISRQN